MVSVFGPSGNGLKPILDLSDRLEAFFRRAEIGGIWFDEPSSDPKGIDEGGFYHVLMTVDFHTWVGE
jgi:hypothetical protein